MITRYNLCKKYKVFNWIDDNIFYYVYDKPKDVYKSIKYWFYCNWNKEHWKLLQIAFTSYGWDGYFLYALEEAQIDKQLKWFENHQIIADEGYQQVLRTLRWSKYLIHTINNESELFHYDGGIKLDPLKESGSLYELKSSNSKYHYDGPYINKKNAYRFLTKRQLEIDYWLNGNCDHEIYLLKAKKLYHKIREQYTDIWWD